MKGHRSIYQSLFIEATPEVATLPIPERKGRSEALKQRQNEMIVCRYYYYIKIQGRQYEAALKELESEICLAERTLVNIINANSSHLKTLHQLKPEIKYFRTKYPFFNWQYQFQ